MEKIEYPITQRRLRTSALVRELTASVKLSHKSFIQPLFVEEGLVVPRAVQGLGTVQVETLHSVSDVVAAQLENGIAKFLLFPVPAKKQDQPVDFSFATKLVSSLKEKFGDRIWLAADLCLCSYTTHGHCGVLNEDHTCLLNSPTVQTLVQYATKLAVAGVDCIAPSDMTDGRIGAIRTQLDALGFEQVTIMSYAAKFSSQFYGPFRDACHSAPQSKGLQNRKTYQHSPLNPSDALASVLRDEKEGADILMIKPAALYTDMIASVKTITNRPVAAYHVSGEYAAIEALAEKGLVNRAAAHLEVWAALTRAGADIIISYAAGEARQWIAEMEY
jgi:porphobilinogen synthase